ncbi:PQQ-dependent sugar dehydrogenase [Kiloniella antarctica]|uniref:PQQ-dependent sugar dehydrogenase n=1 Tax=Kiloniella antarctica TaxID=1550907 RepID=A0ABW5BEW6_9PROT
MHLHKIKFLLSIISLALGCSIPPLTGFAKANEIIERFTSEKITFKLHRLTKNLDHPWGMAFLPDDRLLITERNGKLKIFDGSSLKEITLTDFPDIYTRGQGGLLDVTPHPNFSENNLIYFTYSHPLSSGSTTALAQAKLQGNVLSNSQILFIAKTRSDTSHHYGSRIKFDRQGFLFMTVGDRGQRHNAQRLDLHAGKILRLTENGKPAPGNPFVNHSNALPEIYSFGHRNPQGLSLNPATGDIWLSEHGPRGGDELNIIQSGKNYGWPIITYGKEYIGGSIGQGTHHPNMSQPIHQWTPSIAPAGITFYTGEAFPSWQGNLFTSALKFKLLVRQEIKNNKVVLEERLLEGEVGRIRAVTQGPDGLLYLISDESDGALYRLSPL